MGAWGVGPFENDGAGDFEAELCHDHARNPGFLRETLATIDPDEYLEIDEGQRAVACAATVAALLGMERDDLPARLRAWIAANRAAPPSGLAEPALQALALAASDAERSELYDAWEATEDFAAWLGSVERIAAFLRQQA